jgi:Ca-activated chloride channel homolog
MPRIAFTAFLLVCILPTIAFGEAGILRPYDSNDSDALTLSHMETRVEIDNGMAEISVLQIYQNNTKGVLEGFYEFAIPETAELSGFAIWEDGVRIPGVILERQRARQIYEELRARMIDPGLMEQDEDAANIFSCRVFPIPAWGTKRIELTYTQQLPVEGEALYYYLPTKPEGGAAQLADRFIFDLTFKSEAPVGIPEFRGETLVPKIIGQSENGFQATLDLSDAKLDENIEFTIQVPIPNSEIRFLTYRDLDRAWRDLSPGSGFTFKDEAGFYAARVLFSRDNTEPSEDSKQVVIALDSSLSMQWDKLDRALEIAYHLLDNLKFHDLFGVMVFNSEPVAMTEKVAPWDGRVGADAAAWIRTQTIAGGTDFVPLFDAIAAQFDGKLKRRVVLITDGAPTLGQIDRSEILKAFKGSKLAKSDARMFVVGIGDDAARTFLNDLAALGGGPYSWLASNEDTRHKASMLIDRLDARIFENVTLDLSGGGVLDTYPLTPGVAFGGGSLDFLGRYDKTGSGKATVSYVVEGQTKKIKADVQFPEQSDEHQGLRRRWAKARVMALLDQIEREGENEKWIAEIVKLSKRFTFVTPYTSFLAAPRALLRPRFIRPGDPILRVRTDPRIKKVTASFPFGLTEKMVYIPEQDIWQLRFLAPPGWPDGAYTCKLHLTDTGGKRYIEQKRFVIDGKAPTIHPRINAPLIAGTAATIAAAADSDTRKLTARIPLAGLVDLRYDPKRLDCTGLIDLPETMPPGKYEIEWFAEDFAHNVARATSFVEVLAHE